MGSPRHATEIGQRRFYECPRHHARYTSVTTVLSKGTAQEWAIPWAAKITAETAVATLANWRDLPPEDAVRLLKAAPLARRDKAADAGTLVHGAAEHILSGVEWSLPDDLRPLGERIEAWWRANDGRAVMLERTVWHHDLRVAGTLDAVVELAGETVLLDLKTSTVFDPKWRLQLAAYRLANDWIDEDGAFHEMPDIDWVGVLWVPRERPEEMQLVRVRADMDEYDAFVDVLRAFRWIEDAKKQPGEIILGGLVT
jgi:hypothetical protein